MATDEARLRGRLVMPLFFAVLGWGMGALWVAVREASHPVPRVVHLEGEPPPPLPAPPPEPEPIPLPFRLSSSLTREGPRRVPRANLECRSERPLPLEVTWSRPGGTRELLWSRGIPRTEHSIPLPPVPGGFRSTLEIRVPGEPGSPWMLELHGRTSTPRRLVPPTPGLQSFRAYPQGTLLQLEGGRLVWVPAQGGASRVIETGLRLHGIPRLRRGNAVVRDARGELLGYSLASGTRRWRAPGASSLHEDPVPVPVGALLTRTPGSRGRSTVLEVLEASQGVPMWPRPRVLPSPPLPGSPPVHASGFLLVPGADRTLHMVPALGGSPVHRIPLPALAPLSCTPVLSPSGRRAALGTQAGQVALLDLTPVLQFPERPYEAAATPVEMSFQEGTGAVRRLLFPQEDQLLVLTDQVLSRRNLRGAPLWSLPLPAPPRGGPALVDRRLYLGLGGGRLWVVDPVRGLVQQERDSVELVPGSLELSPGSNEILAWGGPGSGIWSPGPPRFPEIPGVTDGPLASGAPAP